jgi:hypothetical protein
MVAAPVLCRSGPVLVYFAKEDRGERSVEGTDDTNESGESLGTRAEISGPSLAEAEPRVAPPVSRWSGPVLVCLAIEDRGERSVEHMDDNDESKEGCSGGAEMSGPKLAEAESVVAASVLRRSSRPVR